MINLRLSALLVLGLTTTLAACGGYGGGGTSIASGLGGRGAPDRHDGNAEESVSGPIAPGSTMSVKLRTPGTYFIGCAFRYMAMHSMCGVIEVSSNAAPGAQAAPPAGSGGGTGGGGTEY